VWGMNVAFPFARDTAAFWSIIAAMAAILAGMVGYFRRRGWL
jgi:Mg2+ and Co2+ transporter CorA